MIKFFRRKFFKINKFMNFKALKTSKIFNIKKEIIINSLEEKNEKQINDALKYFSKSEIFYLFFIPFAFVSIYIFVMWNIFKYICDIKDINHFLKILRWLKGKESYPYEYLQNKKKKKRKSESIIVIEKKFE
ncbi:conserved Plasmodium protein, unknown function [Plasmodium gallinaceum]|uniref:Uncharacterized protein n=1 Tax=Plasmodium gallinaceum TaxID=5849 RepID=A0A1J1H113_PLAGA|nr:conserved Plasmodium protein, unknown function [Plasmodium gallinaceum]CRG96965.1 conserved Plasmodium protein, unknown function [Plasmodium gallinaceum]